VSLSFIVYILLLRFLDEHLTGFYESFLKPLRDKAGACGADLRALLIKSKGPAAVFLLFVVFFALAVRGSYTVYLKPLSERLSQGVTTEHEALRAFADSSLYASADFILNSNLSFNQMMAEYYSPLGRTFTVNDFGYSPRKMKDSFEEGDFYISDTHGFKLYDMNASLIFANNIYSVYRLEEESILISGYSGFKKNILYRGIGFAFQVDEENKIDFDLISIKERVADFSIDFLQSDRGKSSFGLRAFVNGEEISEQSMTSSLSQISKNAASNLYQATIVVKDVKLHEGPNGMSFELKVSGDDSKVYVDKVRFLNVRPH
jgi:hypothetical protein